MRERRIRMDMAGRAAPSTAAPSGHSMCRCSAASRTTRGRERRRECVAHLMASTGACDAIRIRLTNHVRPSGPARASMVPCVDASWLDRAMRPGGAKGEATPRSTRRLHALPLSVGQGAGNAWTIGRNRHRVLALSCRRDDTSDPDSLFIRVLMSAPMGFPERLLEPCGCAAEQALRGILAGCR